MSDKHSWDLVTVHNLQPRCGDPAKGGTGPLQKTDETYCIDTGNTQAVEVKEKEPVRQMLLGKSPDFSREHTSHESYDIDTQNKHGIESGQRIRRLTEIECERLQGFEDNHTQYGNFDGEVKKVSKTQRYKQMGNAVTRKMVQIIGLKLKEII